MKRLFLRLNLIFGTFVFGSLEIKWSRPRATQSGSDYSNFANNPGEFIRLHKLVAFSVCDNLEMAFNSFAIFEWHFTRVDRSFDFFRDPRIDERFSSFNETKINRLCSTTWQAPAEGTYQVDITVINPNAVNLPLKGSAVFTVKDVWMVILGDSYSSGQGCPDQKTGWLGLLPAKWMSPKCHRSGNSHGYLFYKSLAEKTPTVGFLLTYLACSGASLVRGLLNDAIEPAQIGMIRRIQKQIEAECSCTNCCKKTPDLTIFSIGANDLKFSKIVSGIMTNTAADQFSAMPERLKLLEENFQRLAAELKDLKIVPNSVFFVEYFDLIKNSEGFVDASCGLLLANSFNFELAEKQIMQPLTELIRQTCTQNSWNYLSGIRDLFSTRGVCSNISYVNGIAESLTLQGDVTGAFHPNCAGHEEIAKFISPNLESYLGSKIRFTAK